MVFASSDHPDSLIRPKLFIEYEINNDRKGCTDPLAINFNPKSKVSNNQCNYRKLNNFDDLTNLKDTIGTTSIVFCEFDLNKFFDQIDIENISFRNDSIFLTWKITQNDKTFIFNNSYRNPKELGRILFTLVLKCSVFNFSESENPVVENDFDYAILSKVINLNTLNTSELDFNISLYPNPTQGLSVFKSDVSGIINVFDLNGKLVKTFNVNENSEVLIDLANYSNGIYFLNFQNALITKTFKLIKK